MRPKHYLVMLVALLAGGLALVAQTNSTASDVVAGAAVAAADTTPAPALEDAATDPAGSAVTNAVPAPAEAPAATPAGAAPAAPAADASTANPGAASPAAEAPAPTASATTAAEAPAASAPATVAAAAAPNEAPGDASASAPASAETAAASAPQAGGTIPLIVMDDVPLMDAIRNLARQAGINYMVDPKVAFGADGKGAPPSVSIRWENVTAEQALNALLGNYSLEMVSDPKSKIAHVTVKDPAAPPPLIKRVIQLAYASPTNIVGAVTSTLEDKRSKVVPDVRTSQLVILAPEAEMAAAEDLITRLDTPTKQVLIEARLLETDINPSTSTKKGIDWTGTAGAQHVTFGNGQTAGVIGSTTSKQSGNNVGALTAPFISPQTAPNGPGSTAATVLQTLVGGGGLGLNTASGFSPATAFLNADGLSAVLSFLNTYSDTKVISTPRTVTLDNEPASIEVGTMFPIVNVTASTLNVSGGSSISYSNLTIRLDVLPRISANNYVNLSVNPKILRLGDRVASTVASSENIVYTFNKREISTRVLIPSGNTLVLGGLIEDSVSTQNIKVPLLGDIPILGNLFRSDSKNRDKKNLILFITPTIVEDSDFQPTRSGRDFLKTAAPQRDTVDQDWSAWDSGQPKDWKKNKEKQAKVQDDKFVPLTADAAAK